MEKQERDRRTWKRSVKAIAHMLLCCGDPDMIIVGETRHAITLMCGECHGRTTITQPGH